MGEPVNSEGTQRDVPAIRPLVLGGLIIAVVYGAFGLVVWSVLPDWEMRGQFGDMFGVVNALFSGGALVGVSAVRGKSRHRTVSLDRSMSYGLFCPGTI